MTGHFTTADGCEKWMSIVNAGGKPELFYKLPMIIKNAYGNDRPFSTPAISYGYRLYQLDSVECERGLAHYIEVK